METKKSSITVILAILAASVGLFAHAQIAVTLPSVPTGVAATLALPSSINISWGASTESSGAIADYYVYRNGSQIGTTAGTSFVDSGLTSGVYQYTVAAVDASGNVSAQSTPASITFIVDTTPPSVPTNVTVTGATTTNSAYAQIPVTVSWTASTDNVGVTGYKVYRDGTLLTTSTAPYTGTSYSDTLTPGTHWYTVSAYDASNNISNASPQAYFAIAIETAVPSTPTGVSAQQVSASTINVSWLPSTDFSGIAGYQVFRNGVQIASAAGSPYADTGLSVDVNYSYMVAAYDTAGNVSGQSNPVSLITQAPTGPSAPSITSIIPGTSTVTLSWAIAYDNLPITDYTIYRNGSSIASMTSTSYLDTGLASGTYAYSMTATDASGAVSTTSLPVFVTVPARGPIAPATPIAGGNPGGPIVPPPAGSPTTGGAGTTPTLTASLYFGLRSAQVEALQKILVAHGYLASIYATGLFGNLTLHAVQKFQCDENITCTGGAGWGLVGPKTRAAFNALGGGTSASTSPAMSATSLAAQIQALEAELLNLEHLASTTAR